MENTEKVSWGNSIEVVDQDTFIAAEVIFNGNNTVTFVDQGYGYIKVEREI